MGTDVNSGAAEEVNGGFDVLRGGRIGHATKESLEVRSSRAWVEATSLAVCFIVVCIVVLVVGGDVTVPTTDRTSHLLFAKVGAKSPKVTRRGMVLFPL